MKYKVSVEKRMYCTGSVEVEAKSPDEAEQKIKDMIDNAQGKAIDAWFEAIPEDAYAPCPCGCGKKWKFAKEQPEVHEQTFIEKFMSNTLNACTGEQK